jgi:hypothetical protein
VVIVDRLDKIRQLHNRATMLRPLQGDGILLQQVGHKAQHGTAQGGTHASAGWVQFVPSTARLQADSALNTAHKLWYLCPYRTCCAVADFQYALINVINTTAVLPFSPPLHCPLQPMAPQQAAASQHTNSSPSNAARSTPPQPQQQQQQQRGRAVLVQAPLQVEVAEGTSEAEAQAALAAAGLAPPLLCKPLWTDGRDGSHKLAVLHDLDALGRLLRGAVCHEFKPPLVVQQFLEHGGVLFKVCMCVCVLTGG